MASISFLLGMVPATEKVESADDHIRAEYKAFKDYEVSDELKYFFDLEKEIKSSNFALRKRKVKRKEYKNSEEFQKEEEYKVLKKSEKIVWYFRAKKKFPFKDIEKWELTFEDAFQEGKLDTSRWATRYYWGDQGMDSGFALEDDQSFPADDKNVEFYDKKARIVTKTAKTEGLQWRPGQGFVLEKFDYTSGLISTSKSFRQKYGIFKAKVRMGAGSVAQAFWMVSDGMVPHIDVARFENGKLYANYFWRTSKSLSKTNGARYADTYFIYTLEWSPNKLVWKINGKVFKTQTSGVPQEEMYINFSTHLRKDASGDGLPTAMEIDWIRVYKLRSKS